MLFVVALAGCAESSREAAAAAPEPDSTELAVLPASFSLEGCTGWVTAVIYPGQTNPGEAFDGWEPEIATTSRVFTYGFDCERLAWGPFERQARLVLDYHNDFVAPDKCTNTGEVTTLWILGNLFVNDPELATWLQSTYGVQAQYSPIEWTRQDGLVSMVNWTWGPPTSPSFVTLFDDAQDLVESLNAERVFWLNTWGGVSAFQIHYEVVAPQFGNRMAQGDYQQPMLNAGQPMAQFSLGDAYAAPSSVSADIVAWRDMTCSEPLP